MNDQLQSTIRALLLFAGGIIVSKGYISDAQLQWGVGGALALATMAWGLWKTRPVGIIKSAAKLDQVQAVVVADQKVADAAPDNVKGPVDVAKAAAQAAAAGNVTGTGNLY